MGQVVSKRYVLHMIDRYAGSTFEASCDARGDADMRQVPSMTYLLTLIDRVNGYTTDYRTSEYANRLAVTKPTVDGATKLLVKKFVAGGAGGATAYSGNGATWTLGNAAIDYIYSIAYGGGKFVAGGNNGKMAYSTDGVSWTAVAGPPLGTDLIQALAYGDGKFVAVNENGKIAYSTDGVSWTAGNSTFSFYINAIVYGGGKFVAGGSSGKIAYSTDGVNWTAVGNSTWQHQRR